MIFREEPLDQTEDFTSLDTLVISETSTKGIHDTSY